MRPAHRRGAHAAGLARLAGRRLRTLRIDVVRTGGTGLRVRLLSGSARRSGAVGGPVRRLRQRRTLISAMLIPPMREVAACFRCPGSVRVETRCSAEGTSIWTEQFPSCAAPGFAAGKPEAAACPLPSARCAPTPARPPQTPNPSRPRRSSGNLPGTHQASHPGVAQTLCGAIRVSRTLCAALLPAWGHHPVSSSTCAASSLTCSTYRAGVVPTSP